MVNPNYPHQKAAMAMASPAIALMIIILLIPVLVALIFSFSSYSLGSQQFEWVGLENYQRLFTRSNYQKMFSATFSYVLIVVPVSVALGLGAALLIHSLRFAKEFYKTIYFLPVMASLLAMAIVWEFVLHPTIGIVNDTLSSGCDIPWLYDALTAGWFSQSPSDSWYGNACDKGFPLWLGDKAYALWTVAFISIWQAFGFNMVLYMAGLSSVPKELYHASELDGARSGWSQFWLVTWPMLGPTTVFVVTITTIRSFQVFDTVETLTQGGPVKSTYVIMYGIYEKAIQQNLVGMGSAITIIFLLFVMILTLVQRWLVDRKVHYS